MSERCITEERESEHRRLGRIVKILNGILISLIIGNAVYIYLTVRYYCTGQ
jgi:tetrahydromethanopterin S-methyltransferase subunit G